jgi:glycosyltransferase involved in cell wall biosynthesis
MDNPKISIITPSFNQGQYLEQTILSLINQNYPNLEYIIIDGGSSDRSVEIIRKYEKHLSYWISEPDKGQSDAVNKGLRKATGEIFNWLNSDDYYEPGCLHQIAETFLQTRASVVCGRGRVHDLVNDSVWYSSGSDVYINSLEKTIGWARIDQPETFFKTEFVKSVGGVDERLRYKMDVDLWIKYLLIHGFEGIKKIDNLIVNFRIHENSKSGAQSHQFNYERELLNSAYAKGINNLTIYNFLKTLFPQPFDDGFDLELDKNFITSKKEIIYKSLNYHLLLLAMEQYENYQYDLLLKTAKQIDIEALQLSDRDILSMLLLKVKIPKSFRKYYRTLKQKSENFIIRNKF